MGEAPVRIGKLVRVDLRGVLQYDPDLKFDGKVGLVIGKNNSVRSWQVLIDGEITRFNSVFLDVIDGN